MKMRVTIRTIVSLPGLFGPCGLLLPALPAAAQQDTLLHNIPAPAGEMAGANFASSVAVEGGLTVVGVPKDGSAAANSGVVKVFDSTTGALLHVIPNPGAAGEDRFGGAVAISGTRIVVGAGGDDTGATDAGCAYVYDLSSPTPLVPVHTLPNPGPAEGDGFGLSVAISGMRVVVGAQLIDRGYENDGSAFVYDLSSPPW